MVKFKCEMCGAVWTKDDSYRGMEIRCANCQGACKCLQEDVQETGGYECAECGLACVEGVDKCPACGGKVIASVRDDEKTPMPSSDDSVSSSFRENFFWGFVFPVPTLVLGILFLLVRGLRFKRTISLGLICGALLRDLLVVGLICLVYFSK